MAAPINQLKARLQAGDVTTGLWLTLGHAAASEIAGWAGFDWCVIDGEHAPNTLPSIQAQLQALAGTPAQAIVRVPVAEDWVIKQALDLGVQTLIVPMIHDAEVAARAGAAARYPPAGVRGLGASMSRAGRWGGLDGYPATANDQICLIVQAESARAVADIDAIAATPGVDGIFIGPSDLAADIGHLGNPGHPDVQTAIDHVIARVRAAGKVVGILTFDPETFAPYAAKGVQMLAVGAESHSLARALNALAARANAAKG